MRLSDDSYQLVDTSFEELNEVQLLSHYHEASSAMDTSKIYQLRVNDEVNINTIDFVAVRDQEPDLKIKIVQSATGIKISTTPNISNLNSLSYYEYLALYAVLHISAYRIFFHPSERRQFLLVYAKPYGLQSEVDLDQYFKIQYDKGTLLAQPINDAILRADFSTPHAEGIPLPLKATHENESDLARQTILVMGSHKYYSQLRFDLIEAGRTQTGKTKAPFKPLHAQDLLWKSQQASAVKFYAAVGTFENAYAEQEDEQNIAALIAICRNPLSLPIYLHQREISDNITVKSIKPIMLEHLQATMIIRVFKRAPFYEIRAALRWHEQEFAVKTLPLKHRYFLQQGAVYSLISNPHLLQLLAYFRKRPEILLLHESKYDEFVQGVLEPLEDYIEIQYASIRQATNEEQAEILHQTEKIIYLSHRGNYVYLTPAIRYGHAEIPLVSKKQIKGLDANGNSFLVERDADLEDQFNMFLAGMHPYFEEQLTERDYFYLHQDAFVADNWFLSVFERLRQEHIHILGEKNLKLDRINLHHAKIDIKILSGMDWFNAKINVAFGDQNASIKQLYRAIRNKNQYVELDDGTRGILPDAWLEKLAQIFALGAIKEEQIDIPKTRFAALEEMEEIAEIQLSAEARMEIERYAQQLRSPDQSSDVDVPSTLHTTLRSYQMQGLAWLAKLDQFNFGGCLADDMGLGKTVQILALLLHQRQQKTAKTALIVVPTSLLFNWEQEIQRYAPSLKTHILYGKGRSKAAANWSSYDVILTSYGVMVSDIAKLKKFTFDTIVLDESQAIKNPNAIRYKSAMQLLSRNRFVLTGTPIENSTYDLYGQLSFACPGLLGNATYFRDTYATPIDRFDDTKRSAELQQYIAPFILRRTKKQVATELPEKTEMVIYCELGNKQRAIYDTYEAELRHYVAEQDDDDLEKNSMHVLAGLTRLRQIANAPALLQEGYDAAISAKMDAMLEQLDNLVSQHKVLIFSQFVSMLKLIQARLEERGWSYSILTGQTINRAEEVKQFQQDEHRRIFLVSLKAGGVGLNLTAADYIFLIDPWWNPAVENQAIDRSYRIGQDKHLTAVRFIALDTVEQKMMQLQQKKRDLAGTLISPNAITSQKMSRKDVMDLLG